MTETRTSHFSSLPSSSTSARVRLEPVSRYLFRRVVVVPVLAGLSLVTALPAFAQTTSAPVASTDSGSLGPVVTIVKPEYSDVLKGTAPIAIAVVPRRYPAQSVQLFVDGKPFSQVFPIRSKFNWDTTLMYEGGARVFPDGMHTLSVRVTDTQGFIGQSETRVFISNDAPKTSDSQAPVLNWLHLQNGQTLSGEVSVHLNASDNFGVKFVFLRLNNAITPDEKSQVASWMTNRPPYEFRLDTSRFDDGDYILNSTAMDANNNETAAPSLRVKFLNHGLAPTGGTAMNFDPNAGETPTTNAGGAGASTQGTNQGGTKSNNVQLPAMPNPNIPTPSNPMGGEQVKSGPDGTHWTERQRVAAAPVEPPVETILGQAHNGAVHIDVSPQSHRTDISSEHSDNVAEQPSVPPLGTRSVASIATPVKPPRNAVPQFPSPNLSNPGGSNPSGSNADHTGTDSTKSSTIGNASVHPTKPPQIAIAPIDTRPTTEAATTILSSASTSPGAPSAPRTPETLPARDSHQIEYSLTAPSTKTRLALTNALPHPTGESVPEATVVEKLLQAADPRLPQDGLGLTRIAEVLPDARATDAQTVWTTRGQNSQRSVPDASIPAQATQVETSPHTSVHIGRGASIDAMSTPATLRTTAPPVKVLAQPVLAKPVAVKPVVPKPVAVKPVAVRPVVVNPPVKVSVPPQSIAPMPVRVASTHPATTGISKPAQKTTPKSTPLSGAPQGKIPAVATPPRIALSPDVKDAMRSHRSDAAIVVAPEAELQNATQVATRDETLAAFALRLKTPLEALAAANDLQTGARIKKGQSLVVPQAITVTYKGQKVTGDVAPLLIGSVSVTPFRFMFEQQGGTLTWDAQKQQVTAKSDKYEITVTVGSDKALVNKQEQLMDMAAFLLSGRTMVPVRFFETALHATVEWEPSSGRLYVASLP